jgi:hypothetical protein
MPFAVGSGDVVEPVYKTISTSMSILPAHLTRRTTPPPAEVGSGITFAIPTPQLNSPSHAPLGPAPGEASPYVLQDALEADAQPTLHLPVRTSAHDSGEAEALEGMFPDSLMTELMLAGSTMSDTTTLSEVERKLASKNLSKWNLDGNPNQVQRERFEPTIHVSQEWASPFQRRQGRRGGKWAPNKLGHSFRQTQPTKSAISDTAWNLAGFKHETHEPRHVRMADRSLQLVYNLKQPEMQDLCNNDLHMLNLINTFKIGLG